MAFGRCIQKEWDPDFQLSFVLRRSPAKLWDHMDDARSITVAHLQLRATLNRYAGLTDVDCRPCRTIWLNVSRLLDNVWEWFCNGFSDAHRVQIPKMCVFLSETLGK